MSTLELRHVTKRYGDVVAVDDAGFATVEGEFIALLGPSGCGKSSTMRMIAGLEEISAGEILFDGTVVNSLPPRERNVALAFESYALYSPLTVYENLAFPLRSRSFSRDEIDRRVRDMADQFELTEILERKPRHLSGGQSQRVSLARALVRHPNVLLLDEPLSHLDHRLRILLRARIRHIHDITEGTTTVYVTHDQEEAVALADRIIVMNHARIQQIGAFEDLWERPANLFVAGFIGDPPMNILEAEIDGPGSVRVSGTRVSVPAHSRPASWPASGRVLLGVRPDRLSLTEPARADNVLMGNVLVDEFQGDRSILTVSTEGGTVKCLAAAAVELRAGEPVGLAVDTHNIVFFDPESTEALARNTAPGEAALA